MPIRAGVDPVRPEDGDRLVDVWEASVRATHHFLAESDIQFFRPLVRDGLYSLQHLHCARDLAGNLVGFVGVAGDKMEALFVHPAWLGTGVGYRLARHAMVQLGVTAVDVNEQNERAVAFYQRLGFSVEARSPVDSTGKPFPLLHMRLTETAAR